MVENAINQIVEDATLSKFESTNNAQDEIVLLNIVQVRTVMGQGQREGSPSRERLLDARPCARMLMRAHGHAGAWHGGPVRSRGAAK
jgi:hypothetical protein